ncbi:hypothetical protein ACTXN6_04555 [Corynebacterium casei]|uniref:hypothetical protein n=1 Tax=Corynebacterium casei TaxID=160386 RepID=UPI003FD130BD
MKQSFFPIMFALSWLLNGALLYIVLDDPFRWVFPFLGIILALIVGIELNHRKKTAVGN